MKDVYGRVAESRLLPRERDVVTGHLTARRDDKRRDRDQSEPSPGPRARGRPGRARRSHLSPRTRWAAGAAGLLLVASIAGAFAIAGGTPETPSALSPTGSSTTAGPSTAGGSPAAPVPASPTEPSATAIRLDYSGGKVVRNTCSDPSGRGECSLWDIQEFDVLTVRCTPDGCTLHFRGETPSIDAPVSISGDLPNSGNGCAPTHWTLEVTPVGTSATEGITHPSRLIAAHTANRPAAFGPGVNCRGADMEYRYDATPS